jgi:GntR family transcriptional repressor for pyruvate dehydrogenase complex
LEALGLVSLGAGARWPATVTNDLGGPLREILQHLIGLQRVSLKDLVELRLAVETSAAKRATLKADPRMLAEARRTIKDMAENRQDVEALDAADVKFHVSLVAAAGNEAMHVVMLAVHGLVAARVREVLRVRPDLDKTVNLIIKQHTEILDGIENGDPQSPEILRRHIEGFYERFMEDDQRLFRPLARK